MAFFLYASFPNSRNKIRNATQNANTYQVTLPPLGSPLALVAPSNLNRTYILVQNLSSTDALWYFYTTTQNVNPTATPTFGVTDQILYNNVTNTLYQKQSDGLGTDWLVVLPQDVGEAIQPFQVASLESLGEIRAVSQTLNSVIIGVDEGRG
jgi:hypothetical protein